MDITIINQYEYQCQICCSDYRTNIIVISQDTLPVLRPCLFLGGYYGQASTFICLLTFICLVLFQALHGNNLPGRHRKRSEEVLKCTLEKCSNLTDSWDSLACDRSRWGKSIADDMENVEVMYQENSITVMQEIDHLNYPCPVSQHLPICERICDSHKASVAISKPINQNRMKSRLILRDCLRKRIIEWITICAMTDTY